MIVKRITAASFYVFLANLADAILTCYAVNSGKAVELNPLMLQLLAVSAECFFFVKVLVVSLAIVSLLKIETKENEGKVFLALAISNFVYSCILLVHMLGIFC